jgi:NAD(P)-dependent dehydrogenase (short-subunit alcohol dehydrogenase family)
MTTPQNSRQEAGPARPLVGKVALVVGASRGIGAATARATVAPNARDAQALAGVAQTIRSAGGRALAIPADVTDPAAVARLVAQTLAAYGRLDAACNNAAGGGRPPTPLAELPLADYDSALAISLRGVFLAMKYEIPALLHSGGRRHRQPGLDGRLERRQRPGRLRRQPARRHWADAGGRAGLRRAPPSRQRARAGSDQAAFITGATLTMDGGRLAGGA